MHLKGRLRRTGHDTRVLHLAQVLDGENGGLEDGDQKADGPARDAGPAAGGHQ